MLSCGSIKLVLILIPSYCSTRELILEPLNVVTEVEGVEIDSMQELVLELETGFHYRYSSNVGFGLNVLFETVSPRLPEVFHH